MKLPRGWRQTTEYLKKRIRSLSGNSGNRPKFLATTDVKIRFNDKDLEQLAKELQGKSYTHQHLNDIILKRASKVEIKGITKEGLTVENGLTDNELSSLKNIGNYTNELNKAIKKGGDLATLIRKTGTDIDPKKTKKTVQSDRLALVKIDTGLYRDNKKGQPTTPLKKSAQIVSGKKQGVKTSLNSSGIFQRFSELADMILARVSEMSDSQFLTAMQNLPRSGVSGYYIYGSDYDLIRIEIDQTMSALGLDSDAVIASYVPDLDVFKDKFSQFKTGTL